MKFCRYTAATIFIALSPLMLQWHDTSLRTASYKIYLGLVRRIHTSSLAINLLLSHYSRRWQMGCTFTYRRTQTCVVTLYGVHPPLPPLPLIPYPLSLSLSLSPPCPSSLSVSLYVSPPAKQEKNHKTRKCQKKNQTRCRQERDTTVKSFQTIAGGYSTVQYSTGTVQ